MRKLIMMLTAAVAVSLGAWAEPTVTDITAKQRYPWNGLVDIACKVSGIEAGGYEFVVVAVNKETGREYTVSNFSILHNGEEVPDACGNGDYSLLWNAREDMGHVVFERMTVRITLEALAVSIGRVQLWEGGPYWADRNIGAKKPSDSGLYFWWGDTIGYKRVGDAWVASDGSSRIISFSRDDNLPTVNQSVETLQSEGWITTDGILLSKHDAAHVKWGGTWRMPTDQELSNLINGCDWTRTSLNGVWGYEIRGRGDYASNSIFMPTVDTDYGSKYGVYWSSELKLNGNRYWLARQLCFNLSSYRTIENGMRYDEGVIRPVQ